MLTEIKSLHQRLNATCIYVTHDQIEAMTMADKIVVMQNGNVEQFGSPLEVFDRPGNVFVAGFIGSPPMNLIKARVHSAGDRAKIVTDDGIELPWDGNADVTVGQRVIWGIRPGDLRVGPGDAVSGTIDLLEQTGSETLVFLQAGRQSFCATFSERQDFARGQTLHLVPTAGRQHVFDAASGINLTRRNGR